MVFHPCHSVTMGVAMGGLLHVRARHFSTFSDRCKLDWPSLQWLAVCWSQTWGSNEACRTCRTCPGKTGIWLFLLPKRLGIRNKSSQHGHACSISVGESNGVGGRPIPKNNPWRKRRRNTCGSICQEILNFDFQLQFTRKRMLNLQSPLVWLRNLSGKRAFCSNLHPCLVLHGAPQTWSKALQVRTGIAQHGQETRHPIGGLQGVGTGPGVVCCWHRLCLHFSNLKGWCFKA